MPTGEREALFIMIIVSERLWRVMGKPNWHPACRKVASTCMDKYQYTVSCVPAISFGVCATTIVLSSTEINIVTYKEED